MPTNNVTAPQDNPELAQLVLLADAFTGLNHAFNNHLNTIVLQAAALQLRVPPEFKEALDRIRKEGAQAANLFRPLSWFRQQARQSFKPLDLAGAVRQALADAPQGLWRLEGDETAAIPATPAALKRLFGYLLPGLGDFQAEGTPARISLNASPPALHFDLTPRDPDTRAQVRNLVDGQENELTLPFLAARSLTRLLEGRLECSEPDPKTVRLTLQW